MEEFRCSKCKKKKLKSNFHKSKNAKNGISNWCADCSNETDRIRKLKRRPPPGHRRCIDCKEIKELNQENFKKNIAKQLNFLNTQYIYYFPLILKIHSYC